MSVAFWSTEISAKKEYDVQPPEGYVLNLQQVTLVTDDPKACARVYAKTLSVETGDEINACLCVLRGVTAENCGVSIVFGYDCPVTFRVEGKGQVHLNGYLQPGPELDGDDDSMGELDDEEFDSDEEDSEDEDEEDEQVDDANPPVATKKAVSALVAAKKAAEKELKKPDSEAESDESEEESEDESGSDEEDDSEDEEFIKKMIEKTMGSAAKPFKAGPRDAAPMEVESGSSSEEDSEEEEDSDEESSEEEPPMKVQKTTLKGKVIGQQPKSQNNTPANKGNQQQQGGKSQNNTPANKGNQQQQGGKSQNNTPANKGNQQQQKGGKSQNNTPKTGDKRKH